MNILSGWTVEYANVPISVPFCASIFGCIMVHACRVHKRGQWWRCWTLLDSWKNICWHVSQIIIFFSWHLMIVAQVLCIVVTFVPGCVQSCAQVALLRWFHLPCRTRLDHHQSPDVAKLDSSEGSTDWNVLAYHMVAFFNNYDLLWYFMHVSRFTLCLGMQELWPSCISCEVGQSS